MDRGDLGPFEIGEFFARLFLGVYVGLLPPPRSSLTATPPPHVVVPLLHPHVVLQLSLGGRV